MRARAGSHVWFEVDLSQLDDAELRVSCDDELPAMAEFVSEMLGGVRVLEIKIVNGMAISASCDCILGGYPPSSLLLDVFMKPAEALEAYYNLVEAFPRWEREHGYRSARRIAVWQMVVVVVGHFWNGVLSSAERLATIFKGIFR